MKILVDDREREIVRLVKAYEEPTIHSIEVKRMTVGDFAICEEEQLRLIVERKTWKDLAASISDGRAASQERNMLNLKCRCIMVIEGKKPNTQSLHMVETKALFTKLRRLAIKGIPYLTTANPEQTISLVYQLANDIQVLSERNTDFEVAELELDELKMTRTSNVRTEDEIHLEMWRVLEGVGENNARKLMEYFTIRDLIMGIKIEDIERVKSTNKRFLNKKAISDILEFPKRTDLHAKLLSCIPRISEASALAILNKYKLRRLLKVPEEDLCEIRVNNRKLGKNATKVVQYLA